MSEEARKAAMTKCLEILRAELPSVRNIIISVGERHPEKGGLDATAALEGEPAALALMANKALEHTGLDYYRLMVDLHASLSTLKAVAESNNLGEMIVSLIDLQRGIIRSALHPIFGDEWVKDTEETYNKIVNMPSAN
jgi:hypothetical protein